MVHDMVLSFEWANMALDTKYRDAATQKAQQPQSQQSIPPLMPPPCCPPPPLAPPRPLAAQPAADEPEQPATSSFWQQLDEFTSVLDGGDTSSAVPKPIPNHGSPRAQSESPPARLPSPGSTETIRWRPHRRRTQQRSQRVPYTWPTAPRVTLVAQGSQTQAQVRAQVRAQAQAQGVQAQVQVQVQRPPASELQVSAMLMNRTEGTVPGSREWIKALRAHAHPPTGWSAAWTDL